MLQWSHLLLHLHLLLLHLLLSELSLDHTMALSLGKDLLLLVLCQSPSLLPDSVVIVVGNPSVGTPVASLLFSVTSVGIGEEVIGQVTEEGSVFVLNLGVKDCRAWKLQIVAKRFVIQIETQVVLVVANVWLSPWVVTLRLLGVKVV